ncbi:hypothetical protein EDB87DRAFT_1712805 [Lactarius vividus]|nr:hypothetical protein EDB87DRAFT_1712805 [Lactarius vividus]
MNHRQPRAIHLEWLNYELSQPKVTTRKLPTPAAYDRSSRVQFVLEFPVFFICLGALEAVNYTVTGTSRSPHRYGFASPWVTNVYDTMGQDPRSWRAFVGTQAASHTISTLSLPERCCGHILAAYLWQPVKSGLPQNNRHLCVAAQVLYRQEQPGLSHWRHKLCDTNPGSAPLGILNPWLYSHSVVGVKDIRSGFNSGCGISTIAGWGLFPAGLDSLHFRSGLISVW